MQPAPPQPLIQELWGAEREGRDLCVEPVPSLVIIWYVPRIDPDGVAITHQLVYSNSSPGRSTGWAPTTPSPRTSWMVPNASEMIQWRLFNWVVTVPWFAMFTV